MKLLDRIVDDKGKATLVIGIAAMWIAILLLFQFHGYVATWRLWKIPAREPIFLDLRAISGAAESFRQGYEPTLENPSDPLKRPFNQTWFWRLFFRTGIDQGDTVWLAGVLLMGFFAGASLFPEKLSVKGAAWMLLILFSPAAMLLYERGNVDLLAFFACAMAVLAIARFPILGLTLIAAGTVIKMFPFFGSTIFLGQNRRQCLCFVGFSLAFMLAYFSVTIETQQSSWEMSSRPGDLAYGTFVILSRFPTVFIDAVPQWRITFEILALSLMVVAAMPAIRDATPLVASHPRNLAAFRLGASIYLGTFLLGNNWDYRLTFLIFVIPQLVEWCASPVRRQRVVATGLMTCVVLSCWYVVLRFDPFFLPIENPDDRVVVFDELINWLIIPGFAYMLVLSLPDWLRRPGAATSPLPGNC